MTLRWNRLLKLLVFCGLCMALASCESVKPYQRAYLNDENMAPGSRPCEELEDNVFSYREGSLITGGGKTKGGCGCN